MEAETAKSESYQRSHVYVGTPRRAWGDNPFTFMKVKNCNKLYYADQYELNTFLQGGPCGTPGEYIYLTNTYLRNKNLAEATFGAVGKF